MDLSKYISKRDSKIEIVLGKISDISNQYLVLSYRYSEKKSASGKIYDVYDISSPNKFFDDSDLKIVGGRELTESFKNFIFTNDQIGSVVRYEYDKYLWVAIWLNTYAQLNIPSPIFYNVENIMNDLRMMYFGKQTEDEILQTIRNNWYSGKYQNDLRTPLVDISKKFTDDFSIVEEPKDTELFRNLISEIREEKKVSEDNQVDDKYLVVKFQKYDHVIEELDVQPENLFLKVNNFGNNFSWSTIYDGYDSVELVFATQTSIGISFVSSIKYHLSLITSPKQNIYKNYLDEVVLKTKRMDGYYFKVGDLVNTSIKFALNKKYELGTIIEYKAKFVVIGGFDIENEFNYITINVNAFTKNDLTNKAVNKLIKRFTESEIDVLNKKGKVYIKSPKFSSYNPQAGFSGGVSLVNPFQKQTIMKLGTDLDLLRAKNTLLYDAFVNVINVINKKIESKMPKVEKKSNGELFGFRCGIDGTIKRLESFNTKLLKLQETFPDFDSFGFDSFADSGANLPIRYFTNIDDLINYHATLLEVALYYFYDTTLDGSSYSRAFKFYCNIYNLPIFNQQFTINISHGASRMGRTILIYSQKCTYSLNLNGYGLIQNYSAVERRDFFTNMIRMFLSSNYIHALSLREIFELKDDNAWIKSLKMLNPYFSLNNELLKTIKCDYVNYIIDGIESYRLANQLYWHVKSKFDDLWDAPLEIRENANTTRIFRLYESKEDEDSQIEEFKDYVGKFDQTTIDVFEGKPIPKTEIETDDFLQELDSMDFGDESLFASEVVNELENLDFDDPDLFN